MADGLTISAINLDPIKEEKLKEVFESINHLLVEKNVSCYIKKFAWQLLLFQHFAGLFFLSRMKDIPWNMATV